MLEQLKEQVCRANLLLPKYNLVTFTWGNVSQIDRETNLVAIKPSGVEYADLTPEKIVVVDLDGTVVEGDLNPSSDTLTHLELYRNFKAIGGICHTHSPKATAWAQACREIPCFGTTHADYFYGDVPVTDSMASDEIAEDYELNTGRVIVRCFEQIDPMSVQAVLVANHGPFTWGGDAEQAVEHAVVLEELADMAMHTIAINPQQQAIAKELIDKHYLRKHGEDAYYGQQ